MHLTWSFTWTELEESQDSGTSTGRRRRRRRRKAPAPAPPPPVPGAAADSPVRTCVEYSDPRKKSLGSYVEMTAGSVTYGATTTWEACVAACRDSTDCAQVVWNGACHPMSVASSEIEVGSNVGYKSAHCNTEVWPSGLSSPPDQCATTVNTLYLNGNDCGGSNTEGCVLGVTEQITGAQDGDFFAYDATCYGRCDKGVSNGACLDGATPSVANGHSINTLSKGIWVRTKPADTSDGSAALASAQYQRHYGVQANSATSITVSVNSMARLVRIEMTRSSVAVLAAAGSYMHGITSLTVTGCRNYLTFHHPNTLKLWLQADDPGIITDGATTERIVRWPDRSGVGNDFVAVEAGGGAFSVSGSTALFSKCRKNDPFFLQAQTMEHS